MLSASAWNRRGMCMEFAGNWKLQSERHKPNHQLTASASKILYFATFVHEHPISECITVKAHLECKLEMP
jgi:hypothetical protein